MEFWVDFAAIAGFCMSLVLAVQKAYTQKLKLVIDRATVTAPSDGSNVFFLFLTLTNRRQIPLSITKASISVSGETANKSEIVYSQRIRSKQFDSGQVAFSTRFPFHLGPYESQEICLSFDHPHIKEILFLPALRCDRERRNRLFRVQQLITRAFDTLASFFHRPSAPTARLQLYTSRGKKILVLEIDEVGDANWMREYAVRKSIYDGAAKFS